MNWSGVLVAASVLASVGTASAQSIESQSERDRRAIAGDRTGFTVGASIGRGRIAIECDICDNVEPLTEALSTSLHVGFMVNPRLALVAEHWAITYNDRGSDWFPDSRDHVVAQHLQTFGAQMWVLRSVYLRAGVGFGWHRSDSLYAQPHRDDAIAAAAEGGTTESGPGRFTPAATVGVGWEFAHTRSFAADVQLRMGSTRRPADEYQVHNVGLNFGVAWY